MPLPDLDSAVGYSFGLEFDGRVETFISTLDDILRCLQAAMETLNAVKKREPK